MSRSFTTQAFELPHEMTTTAFELAGYRTHVSFGVVGGGVVRSRSVFGTIGATFQSLRGGDISLFTKLAERTMQQEFNTIRHRAYLPARMRSSESGTTQPRSWVVSRK